MESESLVSTTDIGPMDTRNGSFLQLELITPDAENAPRLETTLGDLKLLGSDRESTGLESQRMMENFRKLLDSDPDSAGLERTSENLKLLDSDRDSINLGELDVLDAQQNDKHFNDLAEVVTVVKKALPAINADCPTYDRVRVLPIYWENSDLDHIPTVSEELLEVFRSFNYEIAEPFQIPDDEECALFLERQITTELMKIRSSKSNNLFIIYYGGHGIQTTSKRYWAPKATIARGSPRIDCTVFQRNLAAAPCDMLFIFDCCYAATMVDASLNWKGRCEVLGAARPGYKAGGGVDESFTRAVAVELGQLGRGTSVLKTFTVLTSEKKMQEHKLKAVPDWMKLSKNDLSDIWLHAVQSSDPTSSNSHGQGIIDDKSSRSSSNTMNDLSISTEARMLISIKFKNPTQNPIAEEIQEMLKRKTPNMEVDIAIVRWLQIHGLFDSTSSLVLMSMPIWLWVALPHDASLQHVGIIRSGNLLQSNPSQDAGIPQELGREQDLSQLEKSLRARSEEVEYLKAEIQRQYDKKTPIESDFSRLRRELNEQTRLVDTLKAEIREYDRREREAKVKNLSETHIDAAPQQSRGRTLAAKNSNDFARTHLNLNLFAPSKKKKSFFSEPDLDEMTRSLNKRLPGDVMRILERKGKSGWGGHGQDWFMPKARDHVLST